MPSRILRDGINDSRRINALSEGSELFYRRLMSLVDDFGRYEADIVLLHAKLYALRRCTTEENVKNFLEECSVGDNPLISLYWSGRKQYLQINDFGQRERTSKFPAPPSFVGILPQNAAECGVLPQNAAYARASNTTPNTTPNTHSSERESEGKPEPGAKELDEFSAWADAVYLRHPKQKNEFLSKRALMTRFSGDREARELFDRNHLLWIEYWREEDANFVPPLCTDKDSGFIPDSAWKKPPPKRIARMSAHQQEVDETKRKLEAKYGVKL